MRIGVGGSDPIGPRAELLLAESSSVGGINKQS